MAVAGYQRQVSPGGAPAIGTMDARAAGAIGAAIGGFGDDLNEARRRRQVLDEQAEGIETSAAWANAETAIAAAKTGDMYAAKENGGRGYAEARMKRLKDAGDAIAAGIKSERVRQRFALQIAQRLSMEADQVEPQEAGMRGRSQTAVFRGMSDTLLNGLDTSDSPMTASAIAALTVDGALYAVEDPEIREALRRETYAAIDARAAQRLISLDPIKAKAAIDAGRFPHLINDQQPDLIKSADDGIARLEREAAAREREAVRIRREELSELRATLEEGDPTARQLDDLASAYGAIGENDTATHLHGKADAKRAAAKWVGQTDVAMTARLAEIEAVKARGGGLSSQLSKERDGIEAEQAKVARMTPLQRLLRASGRSGEALDLDDPASIARRVRDQKVARDTFAPGSELKVLEAPEAQALAASMRLGGAQRIAVWEKLRRIGAAAGDAAAGRAAGQVAPGDRVFALTMGLPEQTARDALEGGDAIKENDELGDKDHQARDAFLDRYGPALRRLPAGDQNALFWAATNATAARLRRQGATRWSEDAFNQTVETMLGGTVDWRGTRVILRGLDGEALKRAWADAPLATIVKLAGGRPVDGSGDAVDERTLKGAEPVMLPNGRLGFGVAGGMVQSSAGGNLSIDARQLIAAPRPARAAASPGALPANRPALPVWPERRTGGPVWVAPPR